MRATGSSTGCPPSTFPCWEPREMPVFDARRCPSAGLDGGFALDRCSFSSCCEPRWREIVVVVARRNRGCGISTRKEEAMIHVYSTGQIARLLGVPAHRIEYAHAKGLLDEPPL